MNRISSKALLWIINLSIAIYILGSISALFLYGTGIIDSSHYKLGLDNRRNYPLSEGFSIISSSNPLITEATLEATDVAISFKTSSVQLQILFLSLVTFQLLYVGFILLILRRIVKSLQVQNPFSTTIILNLRVLAFLLLAIEPLDWIGDQFKYFFIDTHFGHALIDFGGFFSRMGYWIGFNFGSGSFASSWVVAGLLVLLLVEVFKLGLQMKQEQDLTI